MSHKNFTWFGNAKLGLTACGVGIWCTGPVLNCEMGCGVGIDCWLIAPLEYQSKNNFFFNNSNSHLITVNSSSFPERVISIFASWWLRWTIFRPLIDITWSPAFKPYAWAGVSGLTLDRKNTSVIRKKGQHLFSAVSDLYIPAESIMG